MKEYLHRIADDLLRFKLRSKGAVWIRGPKWVGKSTTAGMQAKSSVFMLDSESRDSYVQLASVAPRTFLDKEPPLLIDEWQTIPFIWDQIRMEVDRRDEFGQFILTGSVQPDPDVMSKMHSGIGRITEMMMRPMTLFESHESTGSISLEAIVRGDKPAPCRCDADLHDYAFYTARGGWPKAIGRDRDVALQQAIYYFEGIVAAEASGPGAKALNRDRIRLILRSYARNCATQAKITAIRSDIKANDGASIDDDTIRKYLKALRALYVIEDSEAWNPDLRSKAAIRTSDIRYFVDPSIGCAALEIGPDGLISDMKTFGFLFENLAVRDLRVYAERIGGTVKHFRTSNGIECDAVITFGNGSWIAAEVKIGGRQLIDEGARNLKKMLDALGPGVKRPMLMMVVTATGIAYEREDGIWVVPLACLGP